MKDSSTTAPSQPGQLNSKNDSSSTENSSNPDNDKEDEDEHLYIGEVPDYQLNFDLQNNMYPEYIMPMIPEVDEVLEDLEDSFELDNSLLGKKMKSRLKKTKVKHIFGQETYDDEKSETHSTKSKDSNESLSLGGSFDSDNSKGDRRSSNDRSSFINLSKISENDSLMMERSKSCLIIKYNSKPKLYWDNFLAVMIVYVIIVLPYKFSFVDDPPIWWEIFDYCVDALFFVDIILTFFHSYLDQDERPVYSLKKIAKRYLKFWFWIDFFSILPLEFIIANGNLNILLRVSRLNKIYKLVRFSRMIKSSKTLRSQNTVWSYIHDRLRLNPGIYRLLKNLSYIFIFCHIFACLIHFFGDI